MASPMKRLRHDSYLLAALARILGHKENDEIIDRIKEAASRDDIPPNDQQSLILWLGSVKHCMENLL